MKWGENSIWKSGDFLLAATKAGAFAEHRRTVQATSNRGTLQTPGNRDFRKKHELEFTIK